MNTGSIVRVEALLALFVLGCGDGSGVGGDGDGGGTSRDGGASEARPADVAIGAGDARGGADARRADDGGPLETVLFKMESLQGVSSNPPLPTMFTLDEPCFITRVMTYHYNATIGSKHPTVAFKDTGTGTIHGPFPQIGYQTFNGTLGAGKADPGNVLGPPDNYWMAYPGKTIPAGTYQVIDSDPATWSHTADQGNRGLTWIYGYPAGAPVDVLVAVPAKLSPATGLAAADFEVHGIAGDTPAPVAADGTLEAKASPARTGFLFAGPKDGSTTALRLAPESGLYMSPVAGGLRVGKTGTGYALTSSGAATLDATTTVLSLVLLHPMVASLEPDVQRQQLQWLLDRLAAGWAQASQAAAAYDTALAAARDPFDDAAFKTAFLACLDDVASAMPAREPPAPVPALLDEQTNVPLVIRTAGVKVTTLAATGSTPTSISLEPGSTSGTALDYYYTVKELSDSVMPLALESPAFTSPNLLAPLSSAGNVGSGFVPSGSYWKYLDLAGFVLQKATDALAGLTPIKPGSAVELAATRFYEVRFFSGGFGYGSAAAEYDFAQDYFPADTQAAFRHNVATAVVETLSLIPGSETLFENETGSEVLAAAILQTTTELSAMLNAKGPGGIEGSDVYALMYNVCKTAVDTLIQEGSEDQQKSTLKKLFKWLKVGGKKAVKLVMSVPGKIAKGGSLANRAYRLARPDSVMELHLVAVGFSPTRPQITQLSPGQGAAGTSVTITGKNFGKAGDSLAVTFNGSPGTAVQWVSSTQVNAQVPKGATSGPVIVTVSGVASNGVTFTVATSADAECGKQLSGTGATASLKVTVGAKSGSLSLQGESGDSTCFALRSYVVKYAGNVLFNNDCTCNASKLVPFTYDGSTPYVTLDVSTCAGSDSQWPWSFYVGCP